MKAPAQLRIFVRYIVFLLWEFRWNLGVWLGLIVAGGFLIYNYGTKIDGGQICSSYVQCFHGVFLMTFFESNLSFPKESLLQSLFFLIPIVGLGAIGDSLVRLGYFIVSSKKKLPEWNRMKAALYRDHIVVVGAGKVGLRIVHGLVNKPHVEPVVVVEAQKESPFLEEIQEMGVPVITGDGRQKRILEQAGVKTARALVLATDDDLANLDSALTAREINPKITLVLRLYDETLVRKVRDDFRMPTVSIADKSAPAFIAAATGRKVYHEFELGGRRLHLIDMVVNPKGSLVGLTVGTVQAQKQVNIVMYHGQRGTHINPDHGVTLEAGDSLLVMAASKPFQELKRANQRPEAQEEEVPI